MAHTSIQVKRKHSDIPCAMALRLTPRSPRRRIRLVTVTGGLRSCAPGRARIASAGLAPATGARTTRLHRTLKSVIRRRAPKTAHGVHPALRSLSAPDAPRPPHPATNVCDDHDTPLDRHGTGEVVILICRIVKRNIFDCRADISENQNDWPSEAACQRRRSFVEAWRGSGWTGGIAGCRPAGSLARENVSRRCESGFQVNWLRMVLHVSSTKASTLRMRILRDRKKLSGHAHDREGAPKEFAESAMRALTERHVVQFTTINPARANSLTLAASVSPLRSGLCGDQDVVVSDRDAERSQTGADEPGLARIFRVERQNDDLRAQKPFDTLNVLGDASALRSAVPQLVQRRRRQGDRTAGASLPRDDRLHVSADH